MEKKEEIKELLRRDLRAGAQVTEQQLNEAAAEVAKLPRIDEEKLRKIASNVVKDDSVFICASTDMGDINNILGKPEKK